ncbi:MAG TPA: GTPase, partial [Methylomirabilota bacterium]|nr:GTPase [Methylomirabilota bacterium]
MALTVAIVGRPNVGKSTLFNRLIGKRLALVDDTPGVTRDRREGRGRLGDLEFTLFDTAGLEEAKAG